jgi:hypothetical protein
MTDLLIPPGPYDAELAEIGARWNERAGAYRLPGSRMNARALADLHLPVPVPSVPLPVVTEVPDARLYDYQRTAAGRLVVAPQGQLLVATPGLGKTAIAIVAADYTQPTDRIVVVAPASLLLTWRREIERWAARPDVYVVKGKVDPEAARAARWIVVSWDKAVSMAADWGKGWPLWILDESVLTKSRKSQRFKAFHGGTVTRKGKVVKRYPGIRKHIDRVWLLSGSPTTRYADDLWAQLNLIWPQAYPSYWRFAERYCTVEENPWGGKVITGTRSGRDAAADSDDLVTVIQQEDVLDLPEYLFDPPVEVTLAGAQAKAYRDMAKDFIADLHGDAVVAANEIARLMHLQQIASVWDGASAKAEALVSVIDGYEPPYLVWTHWRESGNVVAGALAGHGLRTAHVDGSTSDRDGTIEAYKAGEVDALVISLGVGKFGHTLTNTRTIFYVDKSWDADSYFQSLHRVRRIGLKHSPVVVTLRAPGTVDDLVEANLTGKLGGISRLTRSDLATLLAGLKGAP